MTTSASSFSLLVELLFIVSTVPFALTFTFPAEAIPTSSGYLPIGSSTGSAIFYTFYDAQTQTLPIFRTPLLVWLQGGPGCSSMIGNFFELGPWRVIPAEKNEESIVLHRNQGSWNRIFGLLFLDSPIGAGFSIAATKEEIPRNISSVARHLFEALTAFLASTPSSFAHRPIYITGESYAGKYVPALAYYIMKDNSRSKTMNLAGIAVGNGLTDPMTQVGLHSVNAYFSGLVNEKQKRELARAERAAIELTKMGNWSEATNARNRVLDLLKTYTGLATLYDWRRVLPYQISLVTRLLQERSSKKALRANESVVWEECSVEVEEAMHEDVMKSVRFMVEFLLKRTKVLLYQGQCDLRDGVVSTEAWMKKLKWEGIGQFMEAERKVWKVDGRLAGYVQTWRSLTHAVVMGAGHLVPADQSVSTQKMMEEWVLDKGVFRHENDLLRAQNHVSL